MNDMFTETPASGFDDFYARYPRKVGKGQARKAYAKALKIARHDDIMFGLAQQMPKLEATEKQFIAHPATWLNGERWDDEPSDMAGPGNSGHGNTGNGGGMAGSKIIQKNADFGAKYAARRSQGGRAWSNT